MQPLQRKPWPQSRQWRRPNPLQPEGSFLISWAGTCWYRPEQPACFTFLRTNSEGYVSWFLKCDVGLRHHKTLQLVQESLMANKRRTNPQSTTASSHTATNIQCSRKVWQIVLRLGRQAAVLQTLATKICLRQRVSKASGPDRISLEKKNEPT